MRLGVIISGVAAPDHTAAASQLEASPNYEAFYFLRRMLYPLEEERNHINKIFEILRNMSEELLDNLPNLAFAGLSRCEALCPSKFRQIIFFVK